MATRPLLTVLPAELWDKIFEDTLDDWKSLCEHETGRRTLNDQIITLRQISKQHAADTPFIKQLLVHIQHLAFAYPPSLIRLAQTTRYAANFIDSFDAPNLAGDGVSGQCLRLNLKRLGLVHVDAGMLHFSDRDTVWALTARAQRAANIQAVSKAITQAHTLPGREGNLLTIRFSVPAGGRGGIDTELVRSQYSSHCAVALELRAKADGTWEEVDREESRHMHFVYDPAIFSASIWSVRWVLEDGGWGLERQRVRSRREGRTPWPCDCEPSMAEYVEWVISGQQKLEYSIKGRLLRQVPAWE